VIILTLPSLQRSFYKHAPFPLSADALPCLFVVGDREGINMSYSFTMISFFPPHLLCLFFLCRPLFLPAGELADFCLDVRRYFRCFLPPPFFFRSWGPPHLSFQLRHQTISVFPCFSLSHISCPQQASVFFSSGLVRGPDNHFPPSREHTSSRYP